MRNKDPYEALRFREFNVFLIVRFALTFAWSMQFAVIEWEVYDLSKDPLSLGIIGLMEVIPAVSMALFAGHIVDQREKKSLLIKCILGFTVVSLGLFLITHPQLVEGWPQKKVLYGVYALVFLGGLVRAFFGPTLFSFLALIVPRKTYANATSWNTTFSKTGSVLGPAVGGLMIGWIGVHWSLCVIFGIALLALLFLTQIKKKPVLNPKIGEPVMKSLKNGLGFVYNNKIILGALTLDMIAVLLGDAISLTPIFAQDILDVGSQGYGLLRAAPAIGSLITMLLSTRFPINKNAGVKLFLAIFGFGLSIIAFGLSSWFWVSLVALMFSGATDGISLVIRQTILQLKTPDEMRGRVSSVNSIFVGSSNELGAFESGITAKWMGAVVAVVFGGSMTLLTVGAAALGFPKLRKLDLKEDMEESKAK